MTKQKLTKLEAQALDAVAKRLLLSLLTNTDEIPTKTQIRAAFKAHKFAIRRFPIVPSFLWGTALEVMILEVQREGGKAKTLLSWQRTRR